MISIEALWSALEASGAYGAVRRVDETHPCDLYAALDSVGHRGLVLVTETTPPSPPRFEAVEIVVAQRSDGRCSLAIWLKADALTSMFVRLCQDLIDATREIAPSAAGSYLLSRLIRWQRLFEVGDSALLGPAEVRGLVGELIVLQRCFDSWPSADVVQSWVGPMGAPQDFTLPTLRIEVKTVRPGASTTRISSVEQLDVDDSVLFLAVVTLATLMPDMPGLSLPMVVDSIRKHLLDAGAHAATLEFESRLASSGYADLPEYTRQLFRLESIRYFEVREAFPRLRRADLPSGIGDVNYEIEIGRCTPFEVELAQENDGH